MRRCLLSVGLVVLLPALALAQQVAGTRIDSAPIAKIPAERTSDFRLLTNPDISRVAIIDRFENGHWYIDVNDLIWEFYETVDAGSAQFSPDGKQLALFAKRGGKWYLVCENKEIQELGTEPPKLLRFSANSAHIAWVKRLATGREQVCEDGKVVAEYAAVRQMALTADGSHLAYTATEGREIIVGRDGEALKKYEGEEVSEAVFSEDGAHVGWAILRTAEAAKAVDLMSDDGVVATYAAKADAEHLTLSPDGKRVVWTQGGTGSAELVANGIPRVLNQDTVRHVVWSPDGRHWACIGGRSEPLRSKSHRMLIVDGDELEEPGESDAAPTFAADGRILRYGDDGSRTMYFDGQSWGPYRGVASPDGRTNVFDQSQEVYINGIATGFEKLIDVQFGETGKAYVLVESPRHVHVNGKILNQLTRISVTADR